MPVMEWGICNNLNYTKWGQVRKIAVFRPCFLWFHRKIVKKPLTNMYGGYTSFESRCSETLVLQQKPVRGACRAQGGGCEGFSLF